MGGESLLRCMARIALACRPAGCVVVFGARAPRLRGDRGARELLRDPRHRAIGLELPAAALDIDRPSDLAELWRRG